MITRRAHQQGTIVTFRLPIDRPTSVVADFNYWDPLVSPLRPASNGEGEMSVLLPAGRYAFRYLADGGDWFDEQDADSIETDPEGRTHSILIV
jgi:hypothetical protein